MTTKNSKVLSCRVDIGVHGEFCELAKSKGYTPGEYLKNIIMKGLEKKRGVRKSLFHPGSLIALSYEGDVRIITPQLDGEVIPEI